MRKLFSYFSVASLVLPSLVLIFPILNVLASTASNLVISEVQIAGVATDDDFVEIYNPTVGDVNLDGYRLSKQSSTGTEYTVKTFSASNIIPAFGYFLWANSSYTTISPAPDETSSQTLAANNGLALQKFNSTSELWENISMVGWGNGFGGNFFEGTTYPNSPAASESIERLPGETDSLKGNGEYTGTNSADFSLRASAQPQNSASAIEIPDGMSLADNILPVAIPGTSKIVAIGAEVSFDGSGSSDSDGTIVEYLWGFGDTTTGGGVNTSHIYGATGQYTVSLRVTDNDGGQHIDFTEVWVADNGDYSNQVLLNEFMPAPGSTTDWDSDGTANINDEWIEIINISASAIDLSGWILDDIDGGSIPFVIEGETIINPGAVLVFYKIDTDLVLNNTGDTVRLLNPIGTLADSRSYTSVGTDESYSRSENDAASVWLDTYTPSPGELNPVPPNVAPTAVAGNDTVAQLGTSTNFDGSGSSDSDGTIVSYSWDFGDSMSGSGATTSHSYATEGTYNVILTITDNDGATGQDTMVVTVSAPPPAYTPPPEEPTGGEIAIVEILPDPTGSDSGTTANASRTKISVNSGSGEYIKLKNIGTTTANLKNWSIDDGDGGSKPFIVSYDYLVKPDEIATFYSSETKLALNNNGDSVRLFSPQNALVSQVTYDGPAKEGVPFVLNSIKNVWQWFDEIKNIGEEEKLAEETKESLPEEAVSNITLPDNKIIIPPVYTAQPLANIVRPSDEKNSDDKIVSTKTSRPVVKIDNGSENSFVQPAEAAGIENTAPISPSAKKSLATSPYLILPLMLMGIILIIKYVVGYQRLAQAVENNLQIKEKEELADIKNIFGGEEEE
ncbi:lamin tail domain-containing protein [Candidatus Microgenomates bacterium]|nr:lamin tail domain-containing protein [Candidatus Microgenomates bacterium]